MSDKDKRFPLSLASLEVRPAKPSADRNGVRRAVATPQTATRNAAHNAAQPGQTYAAQLPTRPHVTVRPPSDHGSSGASRATPAVSPRVRQAMVERIAGQGVRDAKVLAAMQAVLRHQFIEPAFVNQAYIDASLPIGHHQTISQPYIVARMIEVLRTNEQDGRLERVLEIGTGCGYQAAVLAQVAGQVYSIERIKALHELARANLRPLRIANIRLHYGDGMLGLPHVAPFDGIILAAAGTRVPQALLDQLAIGGRLVAPVGERHQVLQVIERVGPSDWTTVTLEDCHFVPLRPGTI